MQLQPAAAGHAHWCAGAGAGSPGPFHRSRQQPRSLTTPRLPLPTASTHSASSSSSSSSAGGEASTSERACSPPHSPSHPREGSPYATRRLAVPAAVGRSSRLGAAVAMGCLVLPEGCSLQDLAANRVLVTGFCAWFAAQFGKIFTKRYKKGVWDIRAMVQPGGMPSSHSSLCAGVTTALALQEGLSSPLFAVSLAFSVIVMYDAMGVRQHAGKQAVVLNQMMTELWQNSPSAIGDNINLIKLKEVLGHTPRQVLCGAVLGFLVAILGWR